MVGQADAKDDTDADYEARAFIPGDGIAEDPVTGSLNASLGDALLGVSGAGNLLGVTPRRGLARLRYRLLLGILLVVVGPSILFNINELPTPSRTPAVVCHRRFACVAT